VVAAVLSVGVVTRNKGDFPDGEGVSRRTVALAGAPAVPDSDVREADGLKGNGIICVVCRDVEERIWTTVVAITLGAGWLEVPAFEDSVGCAGTDPGGRTEKM